MTGKSQGQGKGTQACSEEFSNIEKGINLTYHQSLSDASIPVPVALLIYCRNATLNFSSLEEAATSRSRLLYMNCIPSFLPWNWPGFPEGKTQQAGLKGSYSELTEKGLERSRCTREATYLAVSIWIFLAVLNLAQAAN